ncbi:FAD/NAD(P)-binding domain-containing protein, partial [Sordaria brevicollis]
MEETFDLVIIGSGLFGLAMAKTYHQLHPTHSLAIFDKASSIGGVWAEERLYDGLRTNNLKGTYEYLDYPMSPEVFGVQPGEYMSGEVMHKYLTSFAEAFGIKDKIRLRHMVVEAEHLDGQDGGWVLTVECPSGENKKVFAKKLVLATGLTSEAFLPDFNGQEEFGAPLFHSKELKKYEEATLNGERTNAITVFGGTKSAWDAVYAYALKGIKVDWVIRGKLNRETTRRRGDSGHGPAWMTPSFVTPFKLWIEALVHTRIMTWFSPCIWGAADGYSLIRRFWHGTVIGRAITNAFWWALGNDVKTINKYSSHPETKKLEAWSPAMFVASSFSILNFPTDFFELIRQGTVKIHIADITKLSPNMVHLSNGSKLATDGLCCVTGWKHVPPMKFLPEGIEKELGLPHLPDNNDAEPLFHDNIIARADQEILSRFPRLRNQPVINKRYKPMPETEGLSTSDGVNPQQARLTPWTLYRFMVPPSPRFLMTRDIAFIGYFSSFSSGLSMYPQALWICAFLDDKLPPSVMPSGQSLLGGKAKLKAENVAEKGKTVEQVRYEAVLQARFGKWRYPAGHGHQFPDFIFDALPYIDLMLGDLGLRIHRKRNWFAEMTEPYGLEDYKDIVSEYAEKYNGEI